VELDAVVVGAPGGDGFFDLFGGELFVDCAGGEGWEFGVGGKAEGNELLEGDLVDEIELVVGEEVGEAELLFEADDAVLRTEGGAAGDAGHGHEDDGHDDPPEMGMGEEGPGVDGRVDGEDEVEEQERKDEEVKEGVPARVVFEGLRLSHSSDDSAARLR
jgi:hypothetical protein